MDSLKKFYALTHRQLSWEWFIAILAVAIAMHFEAYKLAALFCFVVSSYYLKSIVQLLIHQNLIREKEMLSSREKPGNSE